MAYVSRVEKQRQCFGLVNPVGESIVGILVFLMFQTGSKSGLAPASVKLICPSESARRNILIGVGLLQQRARQPYRSCCCRQAFMSLTWRRWEDMSVDSTISITRDRSSLKAEHTDTQFNS